MCEVSKMAQELKTEASSPSLFLESGEFPYLEEESTNPFELEPFPPSSSLPLPLLSPPCSSPDLELDLSPSPSPPSPPPPLPLPPPLLPLSPSFNNSPSFSSSFASPPLLPIKREKGEKRERREKREKSPSPPLGGRCSQKKKLSNVPLTEEEKRERNRLAAQKHRKKERELVISLERRCKELSEENTKLRHANTSLETRISLLQELLSKNGFHLQQHSS